MKFFLTVVMHNGFCASFDYPDNVTALQTFNTWMHFKDDIACMELLNETRDAVMFYQYEQT